MGQTESVSETEAISYVVDNVTVETKKAKEDDDKEEAPGE